MLFSIHQNDASDVKCVQLFFFYNQLLLTTDKFLVDALTTYLKHNISVVVKIKFNIVKIIKTTLTLSLKCYSVHT